MKRPYIGVTGVSSPEEVTAARLCIPEDSNHALMVGCLVSEKSWNGIPVKWHHRHPDPSRLSLLFQHDPKVINLVHYHAKDSEGLAERLDEIAMKSGPYLHGFQLNMMWPDRAEMAHYLDLYPHHFFVMQFGVGMQKAADFDPKTIVAVVKSYADLVSYVLLDPSGGRGEEMDTTFMRRVLTLLVDECPQVMPGIAGGLGPSTLHRITDLIRDYPQLSIDAEGRLRDRDDHLDTTLMMEYLDGAFELFSE